MTERLNMQSYLQYNPHECWARNLLYMADLRREYALSTTEYGRAAALSGWYQVRAMAQYNRGQALLKESVSRVG